MPKKKKMKFVKLTMTYSYYGVGKTKEDAKENAFSEFMEHATNPEFVFAGKQDYKDVSIEETNIDSAYIDMVAEDDEDEDITKILGGTTED